MNLLSRTSYLSKRVAIVKEWTFVQLADIKYFHSSRQILNNKKESKSEVIQHPFNFVEKKEKQNFLNIIYLYTKENRLRRGHVEFIKQALKYMEEFGVHKDIEVYKALIDVFPKGKFIPTSIYQVMLHHYPKQQQAALELLCQMEQFQVIPDYEIQQMLLNIFGRQGYPLLKLWRMIYWMPKFSRLNPWPVPQPTPKDPQVLARYALRKLSSSDVQTKITKYKTKDVSEAIDNTWIVSSMSKSQQELLALQPINKSLSVEGPFIIWVADQCIDYFVLKGDPIKRDIIYDDYNDVSNLKIPFWEDRKIGMPVTIHEQDEGVYYAMCATGTSSKDSLLSWIRCLQKTNPVLENIPVVFKLRSSTEDLMYIENDKNRHNAEDLVQPMKILKDKD